jgi:hypothetical protein
MVKQATKVNLVKAPQVAPTQVVAPVATVVVPATLRALRIARLQVALLQQRMVAKKQAFVARNLAAQQQSYMLAVQQLAAQYGLPVPNTLSVRAVNNVQKHAPSAVQGACAQVHAIAAQHNGVRSATLAACKAAGINPATAATQYAKYRKANMV